MVEGKLLVEILNNGVMMPAIGFGTWQLPDEQSTSDVLCAALRQGFYHIDTADCYKNQAAVGGAMKEWVKNPVRDEKYCSGSANLQPYGKWKVVTESVFRENVAVPHGAHPDADKACTFITGKIFTHDFKSEEAMRACVERFHSQVGRTPDLILLHWPAPYKGWATEEEQNDPKNPEKRIQVWKWMEKIYKDGKMRAIGVSNYMTEHLAPLVEDIERRKKEGDANATLPMSNQYEMSPFVHPPQDLLDLMAKHSIAATCYSTLGSSKNGILAHEGMQKIAKDLHVTVPQCILRWALQKGYHIIPRTSKADHAQENLSLNFSLTEEHMKIIDSFATGERVCPDPHLFA